MGEATRSWSRYEVHADARVLRSDSVTLRRKRAQRQRCAPGGLLNVFLCDLTAPPARYAVAAGFTAERVKKGLGFGMWNRSGYKKP